MCVFRDNIMTLVGNNNLEEAITLLEQACIGTLDSFLPEVIILRATLRDIENDANGGLATVEEINTRRRKLSLRIIHLATKICDFNIVEDDLDGIIDSRLVMGNSFPFVDRIRFRRKIKNAILSPDPSIIFVEGLPGSGMSYLEKFLRNLTDELMLYSLEDMHMPKVLYGADIVLGEKLAKSILNKLGLKDVEFDHDENEQFKFTQFVNSLEEKLDCEETIPIFFLHDFHKIEDAENNNLLEFIFALIKEVNRGYPKCVFIVAGLDYRNIRDWQKDLKFYNTTQVYAMEPITRTHIEGCLELVFDNYEEVIHELYKERSGDNNYENMTKEDYVKGMLNELLKGEENFEIKDIGPEISELLYDLKEF